MMVILSIMVMKNDDHNDDDEYDRTQPLPMNMMVVMIVMMPLVMKD